jgi:hypothetical protein
MTCQASAFMAILQWVLLIPKEVEEEVMNECKVDNE